MALHAPSAQQLTTAPHSVTSTNHENHDVGSDTPEAQEEPKAFEGSHNTPEADAEIAAILAAAGGKRPASSVSTTAPKKPSWQGKAKPAAAAAEYSMDDWAA